MAGLHGAAVLRDPESLNTSDDNAAAQNKPWLSIRETLSFDSLRKNTNTNTKTYESVSTSTLPLHHRRKSTPTSQKGAKSTWTSPALRPFTLILIITISLALLVTLQLLLNRSNRDQGVIFAHDINALPLSRTFMYRYFPTIVAVMYSMFWSWIDLETKRVEPWYRLSREGGSKGGDSLLLAYSYDFMPLVPFKAFRERHWPVFCTSIALVFVTWGLVPVQSGIFTVQHVSRISTPMFNVSKGFMPADQQERNLGIRYAQSTYGITVLNETLPPYMTRNYTLAPFLPSDADAGHQSNEAGEWTAPTTLYSLDLYCEPAIPTQGESSNSSWGCRMPIGLDGNITRGFIAKDYPITAEKKFSGMYAGYESNGLATFYLENCPPNRTHTFYAAFTQNKEHDEDPPNNVTSIFCEPMYYVQDVNATIDRLTKSPKKVVPLGPRRDLAENIFNRTLLDKTLADSRPGIISRSDAMPSVGIPMYMEQTAANDMSYGYDGYAMKGLAAEIGGRELKEYLDWEVLGASYAKAYRLLFARAMVDILGSKTNEYSQVGGKEIVSMDAVILEPVFTYIVEGLLAVVSITAAILLYLSMKRSTALLSDPKTLAAIMSLVADNPALLADFKDLDSCTIGELEESVRDKRYRLSDGDDQIIITRTDSSPNSSNALRMPQRTNVSKVIGKPIRPIEFSLWTSIPFVGLFVILATMLVVLFVKARSSGLPLPSNSKLVQNIVENYLPTAIATLIEPMWVLINRLLCLLRPFEELWQGNAKAKDSLDLDYCSLPPQLVFWKALRARHVVLTAVCAMALSTNLLAIAFAGLFYQAKIEVRVPMSFNPSFEPNFKAIDGSIGPSFGMTSPKASGAFQGGEGRDHFLIAESNYTFGTSLPPWTDDRLFYMPFMPSMKVELVNDTQYEAKTTAFGAELDCTELEAGVVQQVDLTTDESANHTALGVTLKRGEGSVNCISFRNFKIQPGPEISFFGDYGCQTGSLASEFVSTLKPAGGLNASKIERDACQGSVILGWLRDRKETCNTTQESTFGEKSFFVKCTPRLVQGHGTVRVDSEGRLQHPVRDRIVERDPNFRKMNTTFDGTDDPSDLIGQSNLFLFQQDWLNPWHNDTFASDFINHFAQLATNNSRRLFDPKRSVPSLEDVQAPLNKVYSNLFAIWLGTYKERLLVTRSNTDTTSNSVWQVNQEERLFLTSALFAIAQGLLSVYIVVAILVYFRRPGRYLPRLPTSIASIIGLFAASAAAQDMRGTSKYEAKERARHLKTLGDRYGYGNFVGVDGGIHVGIEKTPFVKPTAPR